ncbi:site-specific DNA-methyltransferase [Bacteroidales bacterium AH-315-I05]|nr:site-specific DNA-methyltransferase [Bacteroidales bacterium AH-315-I05]
MLEINTTYHTDALTGLRQLPDNCVDCCVTSPPYWGLRDYGLLPLIWDGDENCKHDFSITEFCQKCNAWRGCLGLEPTPELFVQHITQIFSEVNRVLRPTGTLWLNFGDSYANSGKTNGQSNTTIGLKPKDLVGTPWMVGFALRANGWYLRKDIIWHKKNPMPESCTDRPTTAHEYIFLMSKSKHYFYDADAIKEKVSGNTHSMEIKLHPPIEDSEVGRKDWARLTAGHVDRRNKRSVWECNPAPFPEAHFATFPQKLIVDCIKAGCPERVCTKCGKPREKIIEGKSKNAFNLRIRDVQKGRIKHTNRVATVSEVENYDEKQYGGEGKKVFSYTNCGCGSEFVAGIVLDPFMGACTTALVARKLNRDFIGFEMSEKYLKMGKKRLENELGMFV